MLIHTNVLTSNLFSDTVVVLSHVSAIGSWKTVKYYLEGFMTTFSLSNSNLLDDIRLTVTQTHCGNSTMTATIVQGVTGMW